MRKMLLALLVVVVAGVLADSVFAGAQKRQKADFPQLSIMTPRNNQLLVGDALTLQVFSSNTKIKQTSGKNKPKEGYLKVTVDSNKPAKVHTTTYRLKIGQLQEGVHTLRVELVQNDGTSFQPPVVRTLSFGVQRSSLKPGNQPKQIKVVHPARLFYTGRI